MFIIPNSAQRLMSYNVIAPLATNANAIYTGIREFPTNRLFLLCSKRPSIARAEKIKKELEKFNISTVIHEIKCPLWEEIFRLVGDIASQYKDNESIVNVGAGDRTTRCAATSAAFVNGLKAFDVMGKSVMLLPVLKFSYYKLLTDKKMFLLRLLSEEKTQTLSFDNLLKKANMSPSLLSYHINGTRESEGLNQLGLIDIIPLRQKRIALRLTTLGKLLVRGYIH